MSNRLPFTTKRAISLFKVLSSLFATKSFHAAYAFAEEQLRIFQGLALLEIIHGAIGIVPNGPFLPLVQLAGRILCLHATLCIVDEVLCIHCVVSNWSRR
ncbi:hypothetical protein LguiB_031236 [Lonicera macranthoides]